MALDDQTNLPPERRCASPRDKTLRILFLSSRFSAIDGWGKVSRSLIDTLQRIDNVQIRCFSCDSALFHLARLSSFSDAPGKALRLLADRLALGHLDVDIVHAVAEPFFPLAAKIARQCPGSKLFLHAHGTFSTRCLSERHADLYRAAYYQANRILGVSRYTKSRLLELLPGLGDQITVLPNGTAPPTRPFSSLAPFSQRRPHCLIVGAIKPRKGHLELIRAIAPVLRADAERRLVIVGAADHQGYKADVQALISSEQLSAQVDWRGTVSDVELGALYHESRVFALPSTNDGAAYEGFGLVHLEANAWGTPSIGSLGCGNEDAIAHGMSGFLVPQGDIKDLQNRIETLLSNEETWTKMSRHAYEWACTNTWDSVGKQLLRLYRAPASEARKPMTGNSIRCHAS